MSSITASRRATYSVEAGRAALLEQSGTTPTGASRAPPLEQAGAAVQISAGIIY